MSTPPPINVVSDDAEGRSMAALAHASILLNLFIPGLGIIAAAAVWLTQNERSPFAKQQALQAAVFQAVWLLLPILVAVVGVMAAVGGAIAGALNDARVAVLLIPAIFGVLALLAVFLLGILYALVGAYETYQGRDFRYLLVGKLVH